MNPARTLLLWASRNAWLREHVPQWPFVQRAVRRFMPGEQLADALKAAHRLQESGFFTIFTRLGENILDIEAARAVREHYLQVLAMVQQHGLHTEISLKLTQLGLDLSFETALEYFLTIAREAAKRGNTVWIDMEDSRYVDQTLSFYQQARKSVSGIGLCLQAYLYRTEADLEQLLDKPVAIRLVKGAYKEPPEVAFPRKRAVDTNYLRLAERLLRLKKENPTHRVVFGTHDTAIIHTIIEKASRLELPPEDYEFHMLYGIATGVQQQLYQQGQRVGILISYGEAWYPWYMRRLAERPANVMFVLKNLFT